MCIEHKDIEDMEQRIEKRLIERIESSHMSVAKIMSDNGAAIRDLTRRFDEHDAQETEDRKQLTDHIKDSNDLLKKLSALTPENIESLREVARGYDGIGTMRKLVLAIGGAAASITAIIYMLKALK